MALQRSIFRRHYPVVAAFPGSPAWHASCLARGTFRRRLRGFAGALRRCPLLEASMKLPLLTRLSAYGAPASLAALAGTPAAWAQAAPAAPPTINSGDTAWMLTSTALVLMMTI